MLVAALGVTLVGFVLLVIALITSSVAFAWACVVVCLVGFGLLIADVLGLRKGGKRAAESSAEPQVAESVAADRDDVPEVATAEPEMLSDADDAYVVDAVQGETTQVQE